jgi:hypothetical protein
MTGGVLISGISAVGAVVRLMSIVEAVCESENLVVIGNVSEVFVVSAISVLYWRLLLREANKQKIKINATEPQTYPIPSNT